MLTPELHAHCIHILRSQIGPITKGRIFVALAEDAGIRLGSGRQKGKTVTVAAFAKSLRLNPRTVRWWLRALRELADDPELLDAVEREILPIKTALRLKRSREKDALCTVTDEDRALAAATWEVTCSDLRDSLPQLHD